MYLFTNALLSYFPAPVKMFFEKISPAQQKAAHAQVEQQAHGQHGGDERGPRSYTLGTPLLYPLDFFLGQPVYKDIPGDIHVMENFIN